MKEKGPLAVKSYAFAIRVVKLSRTLQTESKEFVLSRQILKSGTSIGALIREAQFAESRADFVHKMSVSLKEANETLYWLSLLHDTDFLSLSEFKELDSNCDELVSMLVATVKKAKGIE